MGHDATAVSEVWEFLVEQEIPDWTMWWFADADAERQDIEASGVDFIEYVQDGEHHFVTAPGYEPKR
jgi:hypothetical protein